MEKTLKLVKELKAKKVFEEAKTDLKLLKKILKKYGLYDKYVQFKEMYFGAK